MGEFGHTSKGTGRNAIEMQWKIRPHAKGRLYETFSMKAHELVFLLVFGARVAVCGENGLNGNNGGKNHIDAGVKAKFDEYKVKVYTSDDSGNKKALDETGFEVKPYFYGFYVEFKNEAKCVELEVKGSTMWKRGNKEGHPFRAYFDLTLRVCIVEFDKIFKGYILVAISQFCKEIKKDPFLPSDFKFLGLGKENGTVPSLVSSTQSGNGLTTQTGKDTSTNLVEFVAQGTGTGSPEYELRDYGHSHTFMFDPLDRCTEIKYKEQVLWRHDSSEFGTSYPIQFSVMKFWKKANVFFPGYAFILEHKFENDQWKFNKRKELKKLEVDKFTFKTTKTDGSDCSDAKDRYTETTGAKKEYEIKANDGFVFFEVNYNGKKVWNYDDMCGSASSSSSSSSSGSACRSRPTLVFAKLNESYVAIYLAADDFLTYHFDGNKWTLSFDKDHVVNGNGNGDSSNGNGSSNI